MLGDDALMNRREASLRRFAREIAMEAHLDLLREALTHSSYANEAGPGTRHNERLEFLGDAVLGVIVGDGLFRAHPRLSEGSLSRLRAAIVNETSLADQARAMGLGDLMWLGKGEERTEGRDKASVLSDAYEAVVAALFLSGGLEAASAFVVGHFGERFRLTTPQEGYRDYKTRLQEAAQRQREERDPGRPLDVVGHQDLPAGSAGDAPQIEERQEERHDRGDARTDKDHVPALRAHLRLPLTTPSLG